MKPLLLSASLLCCLATHHSSQAQASWYTPEVAAQLGVVFDSKGGAPTYPATTQAIGRSRVTAFHVASFDTVATYVQGRVVNRRTGQPVARALLEITYRSLGAGCCEHQAVTTDARGFFRAGWVGTSGPAGGRANRVLQVQAAGYSPLSTQQVSFGGAAYLHIELAAK